MPRPELGILRQPEYWKLHKSHLRESLTERLSVTVSDESGI